MSGRLDIGHRLNDSLPPKMTQAVSASPGGQSAISQLKRFGRAKAKINSIYEEILAYGCDVSKFLHSFADQKEARDEANDQLHVVPEDCAGRAENYNKQLEAINAVLKRDHMKVVFFGRTSNGKSTAINALLGERILPTGIGHTTSCFLQVEGAVENDAYLLTEDSEERKSVQTLGQLGNALCSEKLAPNSKVRIVWPRDRCKMLEEEVVLIDSPGIDVETDLDEWIDKFCLDSDVFVLVANSESTIMLTEKKFFHKVSERLSNPNIFIVHNRSDAFAGEDMQNEVKSQHLDRAIKFLVNELKVCQSKAEAEERIFFISAKEALQARMQEAKGLPPQISTEDFFPRYLEFQKFEREFTTCLSQSAVQTKFATHSKKGQQIVKDMALVMGDVLDNALQSQKSLATSKKELWDRCDFTTKQLELMTLDMKQKIHTITEDVESKVGKAMSEEIRRLSILIDEFNDPFHPDQLVLNVYKSRLNHHIETGIGSNLKSRLSSDLQVNIESHEQEMIERMTALLPSERQQFSRNILPRRESFEVLYHLHFDNLCADFQEDIRFKFSLGFTALMKKFMTMGKKQKYDMYGNNVPRGLGSPGSPQTPTNEYTQPQDDWSLMSKVAIGALTSQGTMGGLLVGGLLLKTVGWRVIAFSVGIYGGVYMYERMTWTNNAKCKEFKRQYVDHAARKLRLVVDMTSANCSHQVQQELSSTFARLCHLVDETTNEMKDNINRIDNKLRRLEDASSKSKKLKNQANFIANKLELFDQTYLAGGMVQSANEDD